MNIKVINTINDWMKNSFDIKPLIVSGWIERYNKLQELINDQKVNFQCQCLLFIVDVFLILIKIQFS
jgi:hypothetical protein